VAEKKKGRTMDDTLKIWTTVGSAGILNQTDLAKVTLHQSIIQLGIDVIAQPAQKAARKTAGRPTGRLARPFPTLQAVARYNVTPVDGLFFEQVPSNPFIYSLQLRYLGHVIARLIEVDLQTGSEKDVIFFDSTSPFFQVKEASAADPPTLFKGVLDFVKKAYYVEATLVAPALVVGNPAAISIIKVIAKQAQTG
jgi:hypothetical protein